MTPSEIPGIFAIPQLFAITDFWMARWLTPMWFLGVGVTLGLLTLALLLGVFYVLSKIPLFDVFRKTAGDDSRSLAFAVRLRAADRTLTEAEVASTRAACIAAGVKLGCTLRA